MRSSSAVRRRRSLGLATLALLSAACVDFTGADFGGGRLISISVTQGESVAVGDTVRLHASGNLDGLIGLLSYDPVRDAKWSVSDPSIAVLESVPPPPPSDTTWTGMVLVRGRRPGDVTVTATARGVRGSAVVSVVP